MELSHSFFFCVVRMQNHNDAVKDDEAVKVGNCSVENVQSFQEEAAKFPYVGDKVKT